MQKSCIAQSRVPQALSVVLSRLLILPEFAQIARTPAEITRPVQKDRVASSRPQALAMVVPHLSEAIAKLRLTMPPAVPSPGLSLPAGYLVDNEWSGG